MRTLAKLTCAIACAAALSFGWVLWTGLTPGERFHILDKAKRGDLSGMADAVRFQANEEVARQKRAVADEVKRATDAVVDEVNESVKRAVDDAAAGAKENLRQRADDTLGTRPDPAPRPPVVDETPPPAPASTLPRN